MVVSTNFKLNIFNKDNYILMEEQEEKVSNYEQVFTDHIGQHSGMFPITFILLAQVYKIYFVREDDKEIVVDICKEHTLLNPIRFRATKEDGYINMVYFVSMILRNFETKLYLDEVVSCWPKFDIERRVPIYEKYWRASVLLGD